MDIPKKPWYTSKTLWINITAAIAFFVQKEYGFVIDPESQALGITIINILLRPFTKKELTV